MRVMLAERRNKLHLYPDNPHTGNPAHPFKISNGEAASS
jgi:hypothetical protein